MTEIEKDKDFTITAVDRALDILIYIYRQGHPVRVSDIARDMGQHKSTIFRALYTMEKKGFIVKNPENETYWLGMKLFAIGSCVQEKMSITSLAQPVAKALYEKLHEVVNLSILELHAVNTPKIIVVHKEESDTRLLKANPSVGKFSDCHSSAAGKCLLAFSGEFDIDTTAPFALHKYTDHTVIDWDTFVKMIHEIKISGYALDDEEREYGLTCLGAPILDRSGHAIAALSIAGPSSRMKENLEHKIDCVIRAARQISNQYL